MVDEAMIEHDRSLQLGNCEPIASGVHFASRWLDGSVDGLPMQLRSAISNADQIPFVYAFDQWVLNGDRHLSNILLAAELGHLYHVLMIDHGHSFGGPEWNESSLHRDSTIVNGRLNETYLRLSPLISGRDPFEQACSRIEALSRNVITDAIGGLLMQLGLPEAERLAVIDFLLARRGIPRKTIMSWRRNFPNWK
jgi:hypothetical protein